MALERDIEALEKKATFFWNELNQNDPDPRQTAKTWRENLRQMRSQSDMHKAVPKPPLITIREDEVIWMERKLSSESLEWQSEETVSEMATNL